MRVLLVEDDIDTCEAFHEFFTLTGRKVDLAFCGEDALELSARIPYDAIFLDIDLPDMTGYSVADGIRGMCVSGSKPTLIAISGFSFDETHPCAHAFDGYLSKPATADEIDAVLTQR